jgi:hypothetical protein
MKARNAKGLRRLRERCEKIRAGQKWPNLA